MTFTDAKQRFSNRVSDYVRSRPSYPPELLSLLRTECSLSPSHVVADVGSGTGLLARLFLDNGNRVFGIEPNDGMRSAGEEFLAAYPAFTSVAASAEATSLAPHSVDFVAAGQAFHWFEPAPTRAEFLRILKPGGTVVVVWQDLRVHGAPFSAAYEELLSRFGTDYARVRAAYPEPERIRGFYAGGTFHARELANSQSFDWDGLCGRISSSSFAPTPDQPDFAPMMVELRSLFDTCQVAGQVRIEYVVKVYFGSLDGISR